MSAVGMQEVFDCVSVPVDRNVDGYQVRCPL